MIKELKERSYSFGTVLYTGFIAACLGGMLVGFGPKMRGIERENRELKEEARQAVIEVNTGFANLRSELEEYIIQRDQREAYLRGRLEEAEKRDESTLEGCDKCLERELEKEAAERKAREGRALKGRDQRDSEFGASLGFQLGSYGKK
jgi:hypothetical protein